MKKFVLSIATMLTVSGAIAQGGYASLHVGYAGGTSSELLGSNFEQTSLTSYTETGIYGTYGSGIPIGLNFGYMFTQHLGFELGFNYFMGSQVTSDIQKSFVGDDVTTTSKGYQIRVLPQLVISTGSENKLNMYSKFGLILPVAGQTTFKKEGQVFTGLGTAPILVEGNSTGKFSLGYTGALGVTFNLSDKLSLFGELQFINLRIFSATQTITKYEVGGSDIMSTKDKEDLETEFVTSLDEKSNADSNTPRQELGSSTNYNSLGLNVGVKFNF
jgi:opacity protein-like surface antigen